MSHALLPEFVAQLSPVVQFGIGLALWELALLCLVWAFVTLAQNHIPLSVVLLLLVVGLAGIGTLPAKVALDSLVPVVGVSPTAFILDAVVALVAIALGLYAGKQMDFTDDYTYLFTVRSWMIFAVAALPGLVAFAGFYALVSAS